MRDLHLLDGYRLTDRATIEWFGGVGDHETGAFMVPSPIDRQPLCIIASAGMGWDHVSVSRRNRAPNQTELDHVFRLFFRDDETAVQYFVPRSEHVNNHPFTLHLWRPLDAGLPKPPAIMVGKGNRVLTDPAEARRLRDACAAEMEPRRE